MTAFAKTLEEKWMLADLPRIKAEYTPLLASSKAQLTGHIRPAQTSGSTAHLTQLLYLDDSGFPFNNRDDAATGTRIIKETFTELGLQMHLGNNENKKSKTEILWIPAPSFYTAAINEPQTTPTALPSNLTTPDHSLPPLTHT